MPTKAARQLRLFSLSFLAVAAVSRPEPLAPQATPRTGPAADVVAGITVDGPWERNEEVLSLLRGELRELMGEEFGLSAPPAKTIVADWTLGGVRGAVDRLLADPEVDIVVALGVLGSHEAARRPELPKPTLAPVVIDPTVQGLPGAGGVSGVENLNYLALPRTLELDLEAFREIVPFTRFGMLVGRPIREAIPGLAESLTTATRALGLEVQVVAVGGSAEEALAELDPGIEAVYLTPLHHLPAVELDRLLRGLIDRRLPSFARMGEAVVRRGAMAGRMSDEFFLRLARRTALNIQRILLGEEAGELPVAFSSGERLYINMATARAVGVSPPFKVLTEAVLLNEAERPVARMLSLGEAVREAIASNRDLAAQERAVAAGAREVGVSRARLLPQLEASTLGAVIDEDRAAASFGLQAQRTWSGSATLSQLLFSEPAWADLSIQRSLQETRVRERERVELDVALAAAVGYLDVLRAKTLERIQRENLRVTRSNLEVARVRREVGTAGPGEVFRWEAELAADRQAVIDASATRNLAEIELNRLLHRPLEEEFGTREADLDDPELVSSDPRLYGYLENRRDFGTFRRFMASLALETAPELAALDAAIRAQTRALASSRRAYWTPSVALQAGLTGIFSRGGAGSSSELPLPDSLGGLFTTPDDLNWTVGVSASLPLFQGGSRAARAAQAALEVARLEREREAARERVESRTRAALHLTGASLANIDLARQSSEAAASNLELVSDAYGEGLVTILELLDAQNAALVAREVAANAVHDFLIDLMRVQRAVGRFDFFTTGEERDAFFQRLEAFFEREATR